MEWTLGLWKEHVDQFERFLAPLISDLGRSERRVAATRYIEGLLIPGERKSMEPMAGRLGVDKQSLQQFVTDSPWSDESLWSSIRREVIPHLMPLEAMIVDETGWIKQGRESVGVSPQYCGAVGKKANCQVSVEVAVTDGWVAAPIGGRLYLPKNWTDDRDRCTRAGIPDDVEFATKPMLAIEIIKDALRNGVPPPPYWGMRFMEIIPTFARPCAASSWSSPSGGSWKAQRVGPRGEHRTKTRQASSQRGYPAIPNTV
jgi:SRSO17 transposase